MLTNEGGCQFMSHKTQEMMKACKIRQQYKNQSGSQIHKENNPPPHNIWGRSGWRSCGKSIATVPEHPRQRYKVFASGNTVWKSTQGHPAKRPIGLQDQPQVAAGKRGQGKSTMQVPRKGGGEAKRPCERPSCRSRTC